MKRTAARAPEPAPLLTRIVRVDDIPPNGLAGLLEADAAERAAIAATLDLAALDSLLLDYELKRVGGGKVQLRGDLSARCIQTCVVTLEPLPVMVTEPVAAEFWPQEALKQGEQPGIDESLEIDPEGPEPIVEGRIDLGHLAYEILASSLDPYPRKAGAAFEWRDRAGSRHGDASGPFDALKIWKQKDK